jgi:hypothetical protein
MCATVLDHEFGPEVIISAYIHPVKGRLLVVEQKCDHCDRLRRSTRVAVEPAAYSRRDAWGES